MPESPQLLPLVGKRIVTTSAVEQAEVLSARLRALGAEVFVLPTVNFTPLEDWRELDDQLRRLEGFDAILFLSKNAVRYLFDRLKKLGIKSDAVSNGHRLIAAVGPTTALVLEEEGVRPTYVAKNHSGESLVSELRDSLAGRRVLLPRSDRGERTDHRVPEALRAAGAKVKEVVAYRTVLPANLDSALLARLRRADVDAAIFASPSAFANLCDVIPAEELAALSSRVRFVTIGATTSRALQDAGVHVEIEAHVASAEGLAESIVKYFQPHSQAANQP
jgi:uroporphyrinogen-III synthase